MERCHRWKSPRRVAAVLSILLAVSAAASQGCKRPGEKEGSVPAMSTEDAIRVMDAHVDELMAIPGVAGVAVGALGDGKPCIRVYVVRETDEHRERIPKELEGIPVVIEVSGEIRPMGDGGAR